MRGREREEVRRAFPFYFPFPDYMLTDMNALFRSTTIKFWSLLGSEIVRSARGPWGNVDRLPVISLLIPELVANTLRHSSYALIYCLCPSATPKPSLNINASEFGMVRQYLRQCGYMCLL